MRYYKMIIDGYIVAVGIGIGGAEIPAEEYAELLNIIRAKPAAIKGYDYRLKSDLTWELYELPIMPTEDGDANEADYIAALAELGVTE